MIDEFCLHMGKNNTVLETEKGHEQLQSQARTAHAEPLAEVKAAARELTRPGFRITAYDTNRGGRERINIEIRGSRIKGMHAWKKTKLCDTEADAIAFIRDTERTKRGGTR